MRIRCRVLAVLLLLFTCALGIAEETPEFFEAPKQITITFTGDCTLGCDPRERGKKTGFDAYIEQYGYEYPFARVKELFEQDDLTVINLEGTFYDSDIGIAKKTYTFRGTADYARMLPMASIEAVSLGNNHSGDYGESGFNSTVSALENNGIAWFGTTEYSNQSWIYEKDGVKIGFVSANISYWWQEGTIFTVKQLLSDLRTQGCETVIACMHGGVEYARLHDDSQTKMADALIRYGADVVVGNHPHVVQGMRVANGVTTLWSLGNFCFGGNSQVRALPALIARITFSFDENDRYLGHQVNLIPVHISGNAEINDYQPRPLTGKDAERVIKNMRSDSWPQKTFMPYVEAVGALQPFVPASVAK